MSATNFGGLDLTSPSVQPQTPIVTPSPHQTQISTAPKMLTAVTGNGDKRALDETVILFDSPIFTLVIGPEKRPFTVHQCILAKSPVLARMCEPGFLESETKEIVLPEDIPEVMDYILQCLYKERPQNLYLCPSLITSIPRIADLYIAADKYQLRLLQLNALPHFTPPTGPNGKVIHGIPFLRACQQVYENTSLSDKLFRAHFSSTAPSVIKALRETEMKDLGVMLGSGGFFAQDVFAAQCTASAQSVNDLKRKARDPPAISDSPISSILKGVTKRKRPRTTASNAAAPGS